MNNKNPYVSIIMNCYNGEKYLRKSINSILIQEYNNWEIIFWNNNSTDNSEKIVKNFRDKRIKYFKSNKYKKLYQCRNLAIQKAKGKFITFLDVDDWWTKDKLKKQVDVIKKNKNIIIVYSNFFLFFQRTNKKKLMVSTNLPSGMIAKQLLKNYIVGILTIMIRRNVFKKFKFNINYEIIGDFDLFIRLSLKYTFHAIQKPLAYYRIHKNNFTKKKSDLYIKEIKNWLHKNENKLRKKKINLIFPYLLLKKLQIKKIINSILPGM